MKSYRDLEIYKISYDLAIKVHKFSLTLPQYEMYEEGSQVRKSSKGVTNCIVEGYGRRRYKAEFIKFLIYSHASCDETIQHLNFIKDTHHDYHEVKPLIDSYEELGPKINRFINYVEREWNSKWVSKTKPETRNP
jgi:four helix bundle protein